MPNLSRVQTRRRKVGDASIPANIKRQQEPSCQQRVSGGRRAQVLSGTLLAFFEAPFWLRPFPIHSHRLVQIDWRGWLNTRACPVLDTGAVRAPSRGSG